MKVCAWVILALSAICVASVLSVLLFPNSTGPFTVTRGPIVIFKAVRSIYLVLLSIALAGLYRLQRTADCKRVGSMSEFLHDASGSPPRLSPPPLLC